MVCLAIVDGAGNGSRTRNPQLGRLMLCQLSYSRAESPNSPPCASAQGLLTSRRHTAPPGRCPPGEERQQSDSRPSRATTRPPLVQANNKEELVEGGGFEPPKASPTDLQSVPFDHSGTPPHRCQHVSPSPKAREEEPDVTWSWRWDLNPQPADYKSAALPIELRQRDTPLYKKSARRARLFFSCLLPPPAAQAKHENRGKDAAHKPFPAWKRAGPRARWPPPPGKRP